MTRDSPLGIAGKCEGAVGERKNDSSMRDPEAVHHFRPHQHSADAKRRFELKDVYAEPAAELVLGKHPVDHLLGTALRVAHE